MRNTGKRMTVLLLIMISLVLIMVGCKKEEKAATAPYEGAIQLLTNSYNGDTNMLQKMAPQEAWTYLKRRGLNYEEYQTDMNLKISDFAKNIKKQYGNNALITLQIADQKKCGEETLENIGKALNKIYGIKKTDVKEAYSMTRTLKVTGTVESAYEGVEIFAVNIDGQWYLLYNHSKEDDPVFYFPYMSGKELKLKD